MYKKLSIIFITILFLLLYCNSYVFARNIELEDPGGGNTSISGGNEKVVEVARKWVSERGINSSKPIPYDMNGPRDMITSGDCSAFTRIVYKEAGVSDNIGGYTAAQFKNQGGTYVKDQKDLRPGDLIFFKKLSGGQASHNVDVPGLGTVNLQHVGIVTENNNGDITMAHFSSSGLKEEKMTKSGTYWTSRYIGGMTYESGASSVSTDNGSELTGEVSPNDAFVKGYIQISNVGVDDRKVKSSKSSEYGIYSLGSKVGLILYKIAQVASIFLLGYILLLWLIYFLAYAGMDMFQVLLLKLTFNKIDVGIPGGMQKLGIFTAFCLLVIVLVLFGLVPKIFALIYSTLGAFFEFIGRISFSR